MSAPRPAIAGWGEGSLQAIENSGGVLPRHLGIEQDTQSTGVHSPKLAQVIDDRIDDDPEIAFLVVLHRSDWDCLLGTGKRRRTDLGHFIGLHRLERGGLLLRRHCALVDLDTVGCKGGYCTLRLRERRGVEERW